MRKVETSEIVADVKKLFATLSTVTGRGIAG
jgi:hypothetical protein